MVFSGVIVHLFLFKNNKILVKKDRHGPLLQHAIRGHCLVFAVQNKRGLYLCETSCPQECFYTCVLQNKNTVGKIVEKWHNDTRSSHINTSAAAVGELLTCMTACV